MGRNVVSLRDFLSTVVTAASAGHNQSWVANELGITAAAVSLRMKSLREKGVKLPALVSTRSNNTVEDANDILRDLGFDAE